MSVALIGKGIVRTHDPRRWNPGKVGGNNIASNAPAYRRITICSIDVKAGIPAQLVPELSEPFVAQAQIDSQPLLNFVVILCKQGCLPYSELAIEQAEKVDGSEDITESSGPVVIGIQAKQKVGPAQELHE